MVDYEGPPLLEKYRYSCEELREALDVLAQVVCVVHSVEVVEHVLCYPVSARDEQIRPEHIVQM